MYCPHCGHLNADGALYCTNCGMRLSDTNAANPAASNPEATASFPRVVASPEPIRQSVPSHAEAVAAYESAGSGARARRVVRSKRPRRNHAASAQGFSASVEQTAQAAAPADANAEAERTTRDARGGADHQATREAHSVSVDPSTSSATTAGAERDREVNRPAAPAITETVGAADFDATRVVPTAARTAQAVHSAEPDVTQVASATAVSQPAPQPAGPSASALSQQPATPYEPMPARPTSSVARRSRQTPAIVASVVVAIIAVGLIAMGVTGIGLFSAGDSNDQQVSTTEAQPQDSTADSSADTSDNTEASTASNSSASQSPSTNTGTSSASTSTKSASTDTTSSDAASSTNANTGDDSKSSDIVDNGTGTVSSKAYGYSISMPSQFTQQYGDETGATYYDANDDITIAIWGDTNPSGTTMESAYQSAKSSAGSGDYVAHGKNWVVYSTDNDSSGVVYDMTYYQNGKSCHMHISYPMSSKSVGDRIIEQVQPTFKLNS